MNEKKKFSVFSSATFSTPSLLPISDRDRGRDHDEVDDDDDDDDEDWSDSGVEDESNEPTERLGNVFAHENDRVFVAFMAVFDVAYTADVVRTMNETDLSRARAIITKVAEKMLARLGVDAKRFYSGALQEVVRAHELGGAVLGNKLQGPDLTTKDGAKVELKDSNPAAGERTNFCFPLPKKRENESDEFYYKRVEDVFVKKGTVRCVHHSHTGKDYEYVYDPRFLAFYVRARGLAGKSKFNIGAMPCKKCNKVHRMCRLLDLQTQWHKNSVEQNKKMNWTLMLGEEVKQNCE